jgi:hypothetical protein
VTALTTQSAAHAGLAVNMTAGLGGTTGHTAPCGNGVALLLMNTAGTAVSATMHVPAATTFDGLTISNRTVALAAVANSLTLIPLPATYADPVTGLATFDVGAGTVSGAVIVHF